MPESYSKLPLELLNVLFSAYLNKDFEFSNEIKCAIHHMSENDESVAPLTVVSHRLLKLFQENEEPLGFFHWDMLEQNLDPICIQNQLIKVIDVLSAYSRSLILVTNLEVAVMKDSEGNQTMNSILTAIEELSITQFPKNKTLNLLTI